jgi:hypothetical protein
VTERDELQAKIFVDTAGVDLLAEQLAARLRQPFEHLLGSTTIVTPVLDLEVERNEDRSLGSDSMVSPEDAFLFFPCVVWASTEEDQASPAVVHAVAEVLGLLDELELDYVTASHFEDELPNAGRAAR